MSYYFCQFYNSKIYIYILLSQNRHLSFVSAIEDECKQVISDLIHDEIHELLWL